MINEINRKLELFRGFICAIIFEIILVPLNQMQHLFIFNRYIVCVLIEAQNRKIKYAWNKLTCTTLLKERLLKFYALFKNIIVYSETQ